MPPPNHPNPELHNVLFEAAKNKTLDGNFIRERLRLPRVPLESRFAAAYINWSTSLTLLDRKAAQVWFAGVSRPDSSYKLFELKHT